MVPAALWLRLLILVCVALTPLAAQSELLVYRYTYLDDSAFRWETGRLRARGFVTERGADDRYGYRNETDRQQIAAVSGLPLIPAHVFRLVPPSDYRNFQRSTDTYPVMDIQYYAVRWALPPMGQCINVSTRATVAPNGSLTPGFVLRDQTTQVLVRAVGPGMAAFGVPNVMVDPRLQVRGESGAVVAENDNWTANLAEVNALTAAFGRAGAFTLSPNSKDAAVLVTLPPGAYTVSVTGVGGVGGDVLAEVYFLEQPPAP